MAKEQNTESETELNGAAPDTVQTQPAVEVTKEETHDQTAAQTEEQQAKQSRGSVFEGIYDQLPDISVKSVDRFIAVCVIALVAVILIGVLKANHVF